MGSKIKLPNTLLKQGWKKLRAHECCSFLAIRPARRLRENFPPRPRHSLGVAAPCFYFVAIFCHGTKLNNASSKIKVKTALVE